VRVKVPEVVIGLPDIDNPVGTDISTEVTVPLPPPPALVVFSQVVPLYIFSLLVEVFQYNAPSNRALPSLSTEGSDDLFPKYLSSNWSYSEAVFDSLVAALLALVEALVALVEALAADVAAEVALLEADVAEFEALSEEAKAEAADADALSAELDASCAA
jgi:hypothetical protein